MEDFQKYFHYSFKIAYNEIYNKEIAEDIASQTVYLLFLNFKKIKKEKIFSWIKEVTKNNLKQYFREKEKFNNMLEEIHIKTEIEKEKISNDKFNVIKIKYNQAKYQLEKKDKELLKIYIDNDLDYYKTAESLKKNIETVKKRIKNIKRTLKSLTYKKLGYKVSKEIVPPNLNRSLMTFLKNLKTALDFKKFELLKRYMSNEQYRYMLENIFIKKIKSYEVSFEKKIYKFLIIYTDFNDEISSFWLKLKVNTHYSFDVLSVKKINNSNTFILPLNSYQGEKLLKVISKAKQREDGMLIIPKELIEKLIEDYQKEGN